MKNQLKRTEKAKLKHSHRLISTSFRRCLGSLFSRRHTPLVNRTTPGQGHTPGLDKSEEAYHRIHLLSEGRLVLLSRYLGDNYVHPFHCHDCGSTFLASFEELKDRLPANGCSHCSDFKNRSRMYDADKIERQVLEISFHGAYFVRSNSFRQYILDDWFLFYCLRHRVSYEAKYQNFLNTAPEANGCPICLQAHLARDDRVT